MLKEGPSLADDYRRLHREVWPEVTARLVDSGITTMRIYLAGRRLFMYMEAVDGFDPASAFPQLASDPVYRRWDEWMRTLQEPAPEARLGEWWTLMEEVFAL